MNRNLKLVVDNSIFEKKQKYFFEKKELKIILDFICKNGFSGLMEGLWT